MIESLIATVDGAYEPARHRELLTALWEQERHFDTPHQRAAAGIARMALASGGLSDARLVEYAADGRTRWQDWTTHLAWDCPAAWVRMGGEVLADRAARPQSVVYWSAPLAETTAPVVDGDALERIDDQAVRGRFVLTALPPRQMKQRLLGRGPAAVLSEYLGPTRLADDRTTKWCNTWADGPDGWYFRACDEPMAGFPLSPAAGRVLRQRLAGEPGLRLTAFCDARLYEGTGQCVTALLPGRDSDREVWLFGHACEQGAHDNASGVSGFIEALVMLAALVEGGVLPRPRCGIRAITTEECLGMLALGTEHPDLLRRAVVGMNVDAVGDATDPRRPAVVHYGPLSAPTLGWAVAGELARILAARSAGAWHTVCRCEPPCSDDMIADPNCGTPTLWLGTGSDATGYHSSGDTPAVCADASLRGSAVLAAAWAYLMAGLDDGLFVALLPGARRWIDEVLLAGQVGQALRLRRWAAGRLLRDARRWGVDGRACEGAAADYCPPDAPPLDDLPAGGPAYARRTWGTCTLETLPPGRQAGLSRWSHWQNAALFWSSAGRPAGAVERLTLAETGRIPEGGVQRLMEACVEAGLARAI